MIKIEGYRFSERVYDDTHIAIYRGIRHRDNCPVIAKTLKAQYPSPGDVQRLEYEYEIGRSINSRGVIEYYSIETLGYGKAIIMEDFAAISLARYYRSHTVDLKISLQFMISLVKILEEIHQCHIIHKDINPYNILVNPESKEIKITDFSISTRVRREIPKALEPEELKGTLAYISPEQTGRMNRSIDFRTDFYSLGVTFYEMVTGKRPFELDDPMELVHAHIAREPVEPHVVNHSLPLFVSAIIKKLISKRAEDRYQSTSGIKADLETCYEQLLAGNISENFMLATKDISDHFRIPEKLYGRESEISFLINLFEFTTRGEKAMAFFFGPPGVGKSSLVNELHKPALGRRAYFIDGKFDQFGGDIPYSAFIQAFSELIVQLLAVKNSQLEDWKKRILYAVGNNGQVIVSVLPRIELIIGEQPELTPLPPMETRNRLHMVFRDFIKVFARPEHPLVLFLDDLQWADTASLQLIDALFTDSDIHFFLLLGAYRDNEVEKLDPPHPVTILMEKWRTSVAELQGKSSRYAYNEIAIEALNSTNIGDLLEDALLCKGEKKRRLAELVYSKTDGNPFFIHEFLKKLLEDGFIEFVPQQGWDWDIEKIQQAGITDNVADLTANRLQKLPRDVLSIIQIAACVGIEFSPSIVARTTRLPLDDVLHSLQEAMDEGIILTNSETYKFSHNKVHEAAYLSTGENKRKELHLKIGKIMWGDPVVKKEGNYLFNLAYHLNQASGLLPKEAKIKLTRLNLEAGQQSMASIAYDMAYRFFKQALDLLPFLPGEAWEKEYKLTLALYSETGEAAYLSGHEEEGEAYFQRVLENARDILDKIKIYELKVNVLMRSQKYEKALVIGREALAMLGLHLPKGKVNKLSLLKEFLIVYLRLKFRRGGVQTLTALHGLKSPHKKTIARILTACMEPAYVVNSDLFALLILKLLKLTLTSGNSEYSSFAYSVFGAVMCDLLGDIETGCYLGNIGLEMLDRYPSKEMMAKTYYVYGAGIHHWKNHLRGDAVFLLKSVKSGPETGDLKFPSYSIDNYISKLFYAGEPLHTVKKECDKYFPMLDKFGQVGAMQASNLWYNLVLFLTGESEDKCLLEGELVGNLAFVNEWVAAKDKIRLGVFSMVRLILLYLFGNYKAAVEMRDEALDYIKSIVGDIHIKEFCYYHSLALLAHYPNANRKEKKRYLDIVNEQQKMLKKWAAHAPENFLHKYLMVEAARCLPEIKENEPGEEPNNLVEQDPAKIGKALKLYSQAVELARQNGFIHEEAIGCENAAKLYFALGIEDIASVYSHRAHYLYGLWNAKIKVKELEEKYPSLVERPISRSQTASSTGSSETTSPSLNFNSVIKASHAISGEIVMEKLLSKLIRIVMENAGAQRIVLFLKQGEQLFIEAEGKTDEMEVTIFHGTPLEESNVPRSIIRFVDRTGELVVLDDTTQENPFALDVYMQDHPPMSSMCMPVVHQETRVGVLYLENKLSLGAFTSEQQETLKVLTAQAAVSLQNAMLYNNLMRAEERVRTILDTTNEGFLELDNLGMVTGVNPELCSITGRAKEYLLGSSFFQLLVPGDRELARHRLRIHELTKSTTYKLTIQKPDNTPVHCLINATPLFDKNKKRTGSFAMVTDLTEYEKKDEQLRQAQKMETVGTLAGGLAHDFNNILGGITGSLSLLQLEMRKEDSDPEEIEKYLDDMVESAGRAKDIVKQLLTLSRKDEIEFESVDLNNTIRRVMNICRNTFEKSIELNPLYNDEPAVVLADPTQLEQILLNLCVNASHAMTIMRSEGERWGGILTVSIEKFYATRDFCTIQPEAEEGSYWKLSVQDNGIGMDVETVSKIFEPFFTTKLKSSGTGLGLSMVYNIVKQHKGLMEVISAPGEGSTFIVYLPELSEIFAPEEKHKEEELLRGEGLILVIDDEPIMRKIAVRILEKAGYNVISAEDGEKGLELFKENYRELKMVLLDMQMPKKSGKETYIEMRELDPAVKVLLASGFRRDKRVEEVLSLGVKDFIEKPYTFGQLTTSVYKILDQES